MELNGSQIVLEVLKEQGVDTVFGYPGGTILNIFDELYKYGDTFNHVLTAHEQGASHAADGYARATGKVGVCFATSILVLQILLPALPPPIWIRFRWSLSPVM